MIRKQVIFKINEDIFIDYNYQHNVLKNIYYYLSVADEVKSQFLHHEGYRVDTGHIFKLFNFTLLFKGAKFLNRDIKCNSNTIIKLIISGKKDIIRDILKGLLHVKKMKIDNHELILKDITDDKKVDFKNIMLYKSLSPIVETTKNDKGSTIALTPFEGDFYKNLVQNAKRKYKLIYNKEYKGPFYFDIDDSLKIKEKFIKFKDGGVRGYDFNVWVETKPDMQKIIYYLGLGQNSSAGLGCLSFVTRG